jgi:hypothetical protein
VLAAAAAGPQGKIASVAQEQGVPAPEPERPGEQVELDAAVLPSSAEILEKGSPVLALGDVEIFEQGAAPAEIDRAPIVRVDERKVPDFGPLVDVRHARTEDLQQHERQRADGAVNGNPCLEVQKVGAKRAGGGLEDGPGERRQRPFVLEVGIDPRRMPLALPSGLDEERVEAIPKGGDFAPGFLERPGPEQRLIEERFRRGIGHRPSLFDRPKAGVPGAPSLQAPFPLVRNLGEHGDPRPDVLASLGVVGGRRVQRPAEGGEPLRLECVKTVFR